MNNANVLRRLFLASLMRRRLATVLSLSAIALGVALGLAVQLIQSAAVDEFGRGIRHLSGEADLQVVGPRGGMDDGIFVTLAEHEAVAELSPVLEVRARLPDRDYDLDLYGIDIFQAARLTPNLMPSGDDADDGGGRFAALQPDRLYLSAAARHRLGLESGHTLTVQSGLFTRELDVAGGVPGAAAGQAFGVMDIAAVQQHFDAIGRLSRIDLRIAAGVSLEDARRQLREHLPVGVELITPETGVDQATGLSRAYRVNMSMLAAIALFTGAFLVFSAQLLSVVRRRQELAFIRALGMDRHAVQRALLAEGAVVGLVGGLVGVALAYGLTALAFRLTGGDLGAGYFSGVQPALVFQPALTGLYALLGVVAGVAGAWLPAREAARMQPARALRAGDEVSVFRARPRWRPALACLILAGLLCLLPPVDGIPVAGYLAVALILVGAVLALPGAVRAMLALPLSQGLLLRLARARLSAAPGQAVVAGAGVVASVALAVSMAIMVSSFRVSVDDWLSRVLPADLYVRASVSSATGYLTPEAVDRIAALPTVSEVEPVRYDTVRLGDDRAPLSLIARKAHDGDALPLVEEGETRGHAPPAWVSEAMSDLFGLGVGDEVALPLAGEMHAFEVRGIWRDYARQHGAVVVELEDYRSRTGDTRSDDVGLHLVPEADLDGVTRELANMFGEQRIDIRRPGQIREASLEIFDRTFFVTYLMEAVAVLIGLFGISTTYAALAVSRRKEFGVLRHLGLERRRVGRLLSLEGVMTATVGVGVGVAAGWAVALVLIEVINRQSFHWSMDLTLPYGLIVVFAAALVSLAAIAARLASGAAMRREAVLAVREDW